MWTFAFRQGPGEYSTSNGRWNTKILCFLVRKPIPGFISRATVQFLQKPTLGCSAVRFGSRCVAFRLSSKPGTRLEEQIASEISKTTTPITNPCKTGIVGTLWRAKKKFEISGMVWDWIGEYRFYENWIGRSKSILVNSKKYFWLKWRTWGIKLFFAHQSVQSKRVFNRFSSNPLRLVISLAICSSIDQELTEKLCLFRREVRYFLWSAFSPRE